MGGGLSKKKPEPKRARRGRRQSVSAAVDFVAYQRVKVEKSEEAYARIANAVKDNFLFSALETAQKQEVYDAMFEKSVASGEALINEGADIHCECEGRTLFEAAVKGATCLACDHLEVAGEFRIWTQELKKRFIYEAQRCIKKQRYSNTWKISRDYL